METIGFHKRNILISRIEDAQEAQEEGQKQFKSTLEQFRSVVDFDGGELEGVYDKLNDEYEDSVRVAEEITDRINVLLIQPPGIRGIRNTSASSGICVPQLSR